MSHVMYNSESHDLTVAFQHIVGKNDKNQPIIQPSEHFFDGTLLIEDTPENALRLKLLDAHKLNRKNGGFGTESFIRQDPSVNRARILAQGEVYCATPENGIQADDLELLNYLVRFAKALPEAAKEKAAEKIATVYNRFQFGGLAMPKASDPVIILRSIIHQMLHALAVGKIWSKDGSDKIEGESDSGQGSEEDI